MSTIDIDGLLQPVSSDEPCGEDLSDLTEYYVLEDSIGGKEETQFAAAEEPQWDRVQDMALQLLAQGKELRVAGYLIHALLARKGPAGLADGLEFLHGLLDRYWDDLYPEMDDEDENPVLQRMNLLAYLSSSSGAFMRQLRRMPFCRSRQLGQFSWRDIMAARGEAPPEDGGEAPQITLIQAAIRDSDPDELASILGHIDRAATAAGAIDSLLTDKAGAMNNTAGMDRLGALLRDITAYARDGGESDDGVVAESGDPGSPGGASAPASRPVRALGDIASQADVLKAFDKIVEWYEKNEPSSPVPLLVMRARKMVGMNFRQIVAEIANNAESQVNDVVGYPPQEESGY